MKKCPYCAEKIQNEATVCRYCGRELPKSATPQSASNKAKVSKAFRQVEKKPMERKKLLLYFGGVLLLLILIAGSYVLFGRKPTSGATPTPAEQGLYSENFDDPSLLSGWDIKSDNASGQAEARDGAYHLSVDNGSMAAIQRGWNFSDTILSVDLEFLGPDPATAIIVCRNQVGGYPFSISSDGHWKIDRSDGKLTSGDTQALRAGTNQVTISCIGDQLSFSLNGVELGSAQDGAYPEGEIALGLESLGKAEVVFDNLTVSGTGSQADSAAKPVVAAASSTPTPATTATPIPTATPTAAPTPRPTQIPADELVLYQTDFENDDASLSKWRTFAYSFKSHSLGTEGYEVATNTSLYRFNATETNQRIFAIYDADLGTSDVDISLHATAFYSVENVGLVCRYSEAGWYQFLVEPKGIWSIRLAKYDEAGQLHFYKISSGGRWLGQIADLRAECKGDLLTFYINGEKQASLHDNTFTGGKVGMLGWSFDHLGEISMIGRFTVQRAQWSESTLPGPAPTPGPDETIYVTQFDNLEALSPYWMVSDAGIIGVPGSGHMYGGPGNTSSPHTLRYINDFDPGVDVEINAEIRNASPARGLICRYSEDGWYQAHSEPGVVWLVRMERNAQGILSAVMLGSAEIPVGNTTDLTLTCAGNHITVSVDGESVVAVDDDVWSSGRYGFMFLSSLPANLKMAFASYTVRPAQTPQPGDIVHNEVFDTPEKIASNWNLNTNGADPRITIQDNSLVLIPGDNVLHPWNNTSAENIELDLDLEFLAQSDLVLHCRVDSAASIGFNIRSNGDWGIVLNFEQVLANGNSASIRSGNNRFTIKCVDNLLTLIANGETLAAVEQPSYIPTVGKVGFDVFEGSSQVKVNSLTLKVLQSASRPPAPPLPNRVSIPVYQPGEAIYTWNSGDLFGIIGGTEKAWSIWYSDERPVEQNGEIVVSAQKANAIWMYQPELNDLPVEVSANIAFSGKSGGIGLRCRYTQVGRYEFVIQPDGSWSIRRNTSDYFAPRAANITVLAHGMSSAIQSGSNQITAICQGNKLIFIANGTELGRTQDDLYPEGQVGILFDTDTAGSFTNLTVRRAE